MKNKPLLLFVLLMAFATVSMAQVTLTQTTTDEFQCGTGQNVIIDDDQVSLQSKMTGINNFDATTNLPQTLMNHELVTWQNYVFCVGGHNGNEPVSSVYRATQQNSGVSAWTTLDELPVALTHPAVIATQQNLIVMGGKNDEGVSNKIYIASLDPLNGNLGEWYEASLQLPQPLWGARAIAVHDNIYLIGGANIDDENAASNKVYCLKLNARGNIASINTMSNLPAARNGHAVATYDSKIYVIGGHDASGALMNTVYYATVNLNGSLSWASRTSIPVALSGHSAVCTNGFLAIIGGMTNDLPSNQIYYTYLDDSNLSWTTSTAVLSVRTHSGASCAFGDKIFYSGGQILSGSIVNYMRYAPVVTGDTKVKKSCYVSKPFDIGNPLKNVQRLTYTLNQGDNTSWEVLYRLADQNSNYGDWISAGTNNPVVLNQTKSAIQYMFRITATGSDDLAIEEVRTIISGYTQLAGNLDDISVLSLANSPYIVTEDISFTTGIHQVQAGVEIYFQENTGLYIYNACLNLNGTANSPIMLTYVNADQSRWKGVYFDGSPWPYYSGVYDNNASSWSYVSIENGGYGSNDANLRLYRAHQPSFTNCTISGSLTDGIAMIDCNGTTFSNCTITNNNETALFVSSSTPEMTSCEISNSYCAVWFGNNCFPNFINCAAYNNNIGIHSSTPDRDFVYDTSTLALYNNTIEIQTPGGRIYDSRTWNHYDNGYLIEGSLEINDGDRPTLTIAPGNTIRMNPGTEIRIYGGGILAVGTVTDSITFTPVNGEVGGWNGFRFYDASDDNAASSIRYCVIEKANINIYSEHTTQPSLMFSTLRQSSNDNIRLYGSSTALDIDGVVIRDCPCGLALNNGSSATMVMVNFDNCSSECVWHQNASNTSSYHTCSMSNSNVGVWYGDPNIDIPSFPVNNKITFNNVTSPVGLNGGYVRNCNWYANEYGIYGNIIVGAEGSGEDTVCLNIGEGSTLRFDEDIYMNISYESWGWHKARLYAEGTEESPITFTSLNGESGGWNGLRFYLGAMSSPLRHCIIEKANNQNVYLENTDRILFENCEFNNSNGYGMRYNSPDYVDGDMMSNMSFNGNEYNGIAINGGTLYGQRTWDGYNYYITSDQLWVRSGSTSDTARLTLSPGTTLHFAQDRYMQVSWSNYYGSLIAEGTEASPVTFTSLNGETGGWNGLRFYGYTSPSSLKHCIIEKANSWNVYIELTDDVLFEDCEFNNSNGYGLYYYSARNVDGNLTNNLQFSGNLYNGIAVDGGSTRFNHTWNAYDYYITTNLEVWAENENDTACLTILPGATLRFQSNRRLDVGNNGNHYGKLIAEGTAEAPITFTSINDEPGGWYSLRFFGNTIASSIKHCIVENGYYENVYVENTDNVLIENCELRNAYQQGLKLYNASPVVRLCSFHHNGDAGIRLQNYSNPTLGGSPEYANDILFNSNWAIYQESNNDLELGYNFFGTTDSLAIEDMIYDKLDYWQRGRVNAFPVSMLPVAGHTLTGTMLYDGNPNYTMPGSTVMVKNFNDEVLYQTTTNATGHFNLTNMSYEGAKKLDIAPNVDVEATITTADALAVMLHYVHETMLSGHRLAAADVNGSETVNGTDALFIQKRYVHQIETMPVGDMYYSPYDSIVYGQQATDLTITALCYGDVNASYVANRDGINLLSEGQTLIGPDQRYDIPVHVQNTLEAGAISLKLNYPDEYLSVEQVLLPNGEEAMIYDNEGQLIISWYSLDPMLLSDNDIMLTLGIRTKEFFELNEPIVFSLDNRSELTDGNAQVLSNVTLTMPELITLGFEGFGENGDFALSVYPNPMSDRSVVRYNLPSEGRVSFFIYDLLGNKVNAIETGVQSIGQHEIELSGLASGIYMGRLTVSGNREEVQIVKIVVK